MGATNSAELDANLAGDTSDDGVVFTNVLTPGGSTPVRITVSTEGFIDAWIDVDADGSFAQTRDHVLASVPVVRGANTLRLEIPDDAQLGSTFSRFRFSTSGGLAATGRANDGEVEDYPVELVFVERPIGVDDAYSVDEDSVLIIGAAAGLLQNDQEPNGNDLVRVVSEGPMHGT